MIRQESTPSSRPRNQAFTLIELLVVIAIIAILSAILFPVFAEAKKSAKTAATASTVNQTGLAANLYLNDYDQGVVLTQYSDYDREHYWPTNLEPYSKSRQVFFDPTRPSVDQDTVEVVPGFNPAWYSLTTFAINDSGYTGFWSTVGGTCTGRKFGYIYEGRNLSAMNEPERRIAFAPDTWGGTQYGWHFFTSYQASWTDPKVSEEQFSPNNVVWSTRKFFSGESIPVVHADGSAGRLRKKDFISRAAAPKIGDWCTWLQAGPNRTWGEYWNAG